MTYSEMWSLTPRSFFNAVSGRRKKEDNESKERMILTRKIMYACIRPHSTENIEEHEIWSFPWEENTINELSEKQKLEAIEKVKETENFWEKQDQKKLQKQQQTLD